MSSRKIFTTQTPHDHRDNNRTSKHRHKLNSIQKNPPPPNSKRGYIVHSKKNIEQQLQQGSVSPEPDEQSPHSPQPSQQQSNTNTISLKSGKNSYQNVKKIVSNKKYRFISPLFILEVWYEKHAIADNYDNNNNHNNNINDKKRSYYRQSDSDRYNNINNTTQYVQYDIGNFYTLSLNLDAIVHSWGSSRDRQLPLLNFLLNRETYQSKRIILKMLFEMIQYYCLGYKYDVRSKLDCISEYFVTINQVLRRAVEESSIMLS